MNQYIQIDMKKKQITWKKNRKYERGSLITMFYSDEYLCEHEVGHDMGVHGCDGCCSDPSFKKLYEN